MRHKESQYHHLNKHNETTLVSMTYRYSNPRYSMGTVYLFSCTNKINQTQANMPYIESLGYIYIYFIYIYYSYIIYNIYTYFFNIPMLYQSQIANLMVPTTYPPKKKHPGPAVPLMGLIHAVRHPDGGHGSFPARVGSHDRILGSHTIPWNWYIYIYI